MQLFYAVPTGDGLLRFDEEESRHLTQVLRRSAGELIRCTDGRGFLYDAELTATGKHGAFARILARTAAPPPPQLHVGIAPTKNMDRTEWFLEKAVEIGIGSITPLLCKRSERQNLRLDRLEKIMLSAMKQSLRAHLPVLHPLTPIAKVVAAATEPIKAIAWCADTPLPDFQTMLRHDTPVLILIGPEGDFTPEEVTAALAGGFQAVGLGTARLRTETAGLMAVARYQLHHNNG
jgi:16S rRNA (uracil1498-N3)-methyltransferase